jgi:hypothetical protein
MADFVVAAGGMAGIKVAVVIPAVRTAVHVRLGYVACNSLFLSGFDP